MQGFESRSIYRVASSAAPKHFPGCERTTPQSDSQVRCLLRLPNKQELQSANGQWELLVSLALEALASLGI